MELHNFINKNQIVLVENKEKQPVIRELLIYLETLGMIDNSNRFYTQVIHRESLENTGIGMGLAIPHARTDSLSNLVSIFGFSKDGIDYQSYDNIPVKYLLLSIFPTEMSTKYLYLVGMMARIFSNEDKRLAMNKAETPEEFYSILSREFTLYFEGVINKDVSSNNISEEYIGIPSSDLDLLIRLDRLNIIYDEGNTSESIVTKIEQIRKLIDNRSLTYYEKMRKKCQNPFAIVEKNSCTGCHLEIPSIYINQIKDQKGISVCTHCGRFLIIL
ncbi:MAG: PTS sugar transporter subunit IIA [Spirochaetota bacterium]|nr:PTS sugar transporter subunit IIA [Spirochaetota bacterium]